MRIALQVPTARKILACIDIWYAMRSLHSPEQLFHQMRFLYLSNLLHGTVDNVNNCQSTLSSPGSVPISYCLVGLMPIQNFGTIMAEVHDGATLYH